MRFSLGLSFSTLLIMFSVSMAWANAEVDAQLFQNLSDAEKQALMQKYGRGSDVSLNRTPPPVVDSVRKIYLPEQGYVLPETDYKQYRQPQPDRQRIQQTSSSYLTDGNKLSGSQPYQPDSSASNQQTEASRDKEQARPQVSYERAESAKVPSQERLNEILYQKFLSGTLNEIVLPYGAQLFAGLPSTFSPVNEVPVPTDYVLGPGDQLILSMFGSKSQSLQLVIDRNGQIVIPEVGPVSLAGMRFSEAKALLLNKVQSLGVGIHAFVKMGELRSFRVFVLGESRTPGSYLVSGMSTLSHALYVSGGISPSGSYRNIQLKRNGRLIKTLDLYDFLLKGDTSDDVRLQPGDTVFIPKVNRQVVVAGEVTRPAKYELKHEKNLGAVLALSGIKPTALRNSVRVSRVQSDGSRSWMDVDLDNKAEANLSIVSGDQILVEPVKNKVDNAIRVRGEVVQDARYEWQPELRLTDILPNENWFTNQADMENLVLVRQAGVAEPYLFVQVNWKAQLASPEKALRLQPRDQIWVLSKSDAVQREKALSQFEEWIKMQSDQSSLPEVVQSLGQFKFAGNYPLTEGMMVADLVALSGGLQASAMTRQVELFRHEVVNGEKKEVERIVFDLSKALAGDSEHNLVLKPSDSIMVKQVSDWADSTRRVTLQGEVRFPGTYVIEPGDTLESVLKRAGGFTRWAEPQNAVFTREALKKKEQREFNLLADELEKNLLMAIKTDAPILEKDTGATIAQMGQSMITKIKNTPAVGRLVVGLTPKNEERYLSTMNLEMRDGDTLYVPKRSSEVVVMGEVSRTASMLYQPSLTVEDYIKSAGGLTKRADDGSIYIVHGDGSIEMVENGLLAMMEQVTIRPGDTIVVPMDIERMNALFTWTSVTKVLSNFAITAATLNTIGAW